MPASSRPTTGAAVLALLAIVDISWPIQAWFGLLGSFDAPPTGALMLFALVGVVRLATVQPSLRGHRTAAWIMASSRVVSVLLIDLPALVLGAPSWVVAVVSVAILLTVTGIWWTVPLLRKASAADAVTHATS